MVAIAVVVAGAVLLVVGALGVAANWRMWGSDPANPRVHDLERLVRESGIRRLAALRAADAAVTVTVATAEVQVATAEVQVTPGEAVPEPIVDDARSKVVRTAPAPRLARGSEARFSGVPSISPALPRAVVPERSDATPLLQRPFLPGVHERS